MCHVDQRVPAAYCEELWPQALKIGQRRSNRKPKCLSLWLGGICPDTGLSSWVCSSFSIGSPTTKSQALQQGRPGLSNRPIFPSRPLCFIFPQRCHTLKDCTCQKKKNCTKSELMYFAVIFIYFFKKIKGYSCFFRGWIWMVTDMTWCFYERWGLGGTCGVFGFVYMW